MTEKIKWIVEHKMSELPCQNCGKLVRVMLPFYGCVFCEDCASGESYETADAPEFKRKLNWEEYDD